MSSSTNDYRYLFGQEAQTTCTSCAGAIWWMCQWHTNYTHYSVNGCYLCCVARSVGPYKWYKR